MNRFLKAFLRKFVDEYEAYNIYCIAPSTTPSLKHTDIIEIDADICRRSPHQEIRALAGYDLADARGFGILDDEELVCACWYWYGHSYSHHRGFWPLKDKQAKLVQITTANSARGKGLARQLIAASARAMEEGGFDKLFARIWLRHVASERAFAAAGWRRIATVITIQPSIGSGKIRLQWPIW